METLNDHKTIYALFYGCSISLKIKIFVFVEMLHFLDMQETKMKKSKVNYKFKAVEKHISKRWRTFKRNPLDLSLSICKLHSTGCGRLNGNILRRTPTSFLSLQKTTWFHLKDTFKQNPKLSLVCL